MKIKVSADTVLKILQGIMADPEINQVITDQSAPAEWRNKTVQDALNVEYYTFKHRPFDTEVIVKELLGQVPSNSLMALNRAFCLLSLNSTDRVFSKDNDIVTVSANLEYWINAEKIKLLEDLVEDMSIATNGTRIPVQIGTEERQILVAFGGLNISEIQEATEFGEMAICDINVDLIFYPIVTSRVDYDIEFLVPTMDASTWIKVPVSSLSISNNMTQKSIPYANNPRNVGNINLSRAKSFVFTFDGYKNKFVDWLTNFSLAGDLALQEEEQDNNVAIVLKLSRNESQFIYNCVVKDHTVVVQEDTGNEVQSLTLTRRGINNGTT